MYCCRLHDGWVSGGVGCKIKSLLYVCSAGYDLLCCSDWRVLMDNPAAAPAAAGIGPLDDEFGVKFDQSNLLLGGISGFAGHANGSYCTTNGLNTTQQQQQQQHEDCEMPDAADYAADGFPEQADGALVRPVKVSGGSSSGKGGGNANRSRRAGAAARVAAAAAAAGAAAGGGSGVRGIPGKVCCECGATQTPQWREGPQGESWCNSYKLMSFVWSWLL
jgi:hypothetical protein